MKQLVSILIPAYNAEKWIAYTINCAKSQTWPNKEIIVVDDGSTDETLKIARAAESKMIKVVSQENGGACRARNNALSLAQGEYIQWLDADDLLHPEKISIQLDNGNGQNGEKILLTCSWGKFFYRWQKTKFKKDSLWQDLGPTEWIINKFSNNVWMNPAVWLVSRYLTDLAGPWDERLTSSGDDDGEYICRVVAKSNGVRFVPEAKCYYRIGNIGSLDWGMGESQEKLESLLLALRLSIDHLLALELSSRTKAASAKYLQTWLPLFYPAYPSLVKVINDLISKLDGKMEVPVTKKKYQLIEKLFGVDTTRSIIKNLQKSKLLTYKLYDRVLYSITNNSF